MNKKLGRFELLEQIDVGGYTTVYRAVEDMGQGIERPAAVKALQAWNLDDDDQLKRLKREVGVLIEIGDAPNIVAVHGMGIDEEMGPWIAMELAGKSLRYSIGDQPTPPDQIRSLLSDVLHALQWVHGTEPPILHRDLKPQNILRTGPGIWKVADFGLAKRAGAEETMTLATVKYAAPELLDSALGEETPRVDIYALGMIAYEMALGRALFQKQFPSVYDPMRSSKESEGDDRPKWMYWHTSMQMVLPPLNELIDDYPQDLSDLIQAMIAKPYLERVASADDALERLGQVSVPSHLAIPDDEDDTDKKPSTMKKIAGAAAVLAFVAVVALLMWKFLEGRPSIEWASGNRFESNTSVVSVEGKIANYPDSGRAEIRLTRGGTFTAAIEPDGSFIADVKVGELGSFKGYMSVTDKNGRTVARQTIDVVRSAPEAVAFEVETVPLITEATIQLRPAGGDPISLMTDANGVATTVLPFGEFTIEAFHPRYQPLQRKTYQTGIEGEWTGTVRLKPRDFSQILIDMQREIDRLMRLTKKKTTCPPGPLTADEEQQMTSSIDRLRQLGNGDADIELFLGQVGSTVDCDPTSMPVAPPLPADPGVAGGLAQTDPVGALDRLLDRVERLIDRKVTCPPGPLSEFEEQTLSATLLEIEATALGDLDIQLYVDSVRRVEDCDPSSRPPRPEIPESLRQQLIANAAAGRAGASGTSGYGSDGTGGTSVSSGRGETYGGAGRAGVAGSAANALQNFINSSGNPGGNMRGGGASTQDNGRAAADSVIANVLAGMPPNPALVNYLTRSLTLEQFAAFIAENVPTGTIKIEILSEVDKVRISGPMFNGTDLEWMVKRLAYGWTRIQPELAIDAWAVCRGLRRALESDGATGARVDAYLIPDDPTMFVQFEKSNTYDAQGAVQLASTFTVDESLIWIRGYLDAPAEKLPEAEAAAPE